MLRKYPLMDGTPGAAGGGEPAAPPAGEGAPPADDGKTAPAAGSLLAGGADDKPLAERVPEKFRVAKEGGEFDPEATLDKVLGSYTELEKRLSSGKRGEAPASPEEYKLDFEPPVIEQLKSDEKFQGFLKRAHGKGFTNEDIQFVVGEYIQTAGQGSMTAEKAQAELQAVWKDENAYKGGLQAAYKGSLALAQKAGLTIIDGPNGVRLVKEFEETGLSNNPAFIRAVAALAPEMKEDSPPPAHQIGEAEAADLRSMRTELRNMDEKNPAYAALRAKVDAAYKKLYGTEPVR